MKLRARWIGALPAVGDYLMSSTRPRYAYLVTKIHESAKVAPADEGADVTFATFDVDRVRLTLGHALPAGATVHTWRWDKRRRKRGP